jgi:hypothetical protein
MSQEYSVIVSITANSPAEAEEARDELAMRMEDARDSETLADGCGVDVGDATAGDIGRVVAKYRTLFDGLSNMIEEGRLSEADIPDDYHWLTTRMAEIAGLDAGAESASFRDLADVVVNDSTAEASVASV